MTRHLLVVASAPDPSDELLERLRNVAGDEEVEVEVEIVVPVTDLSALEWLSDDEERALDEAWRRAEEARNASQAAKVVDAHVGDPDPVTAVGDALQTFPADELIVVTRPKDAATWLEKRAILDLERFGLPVTHLVDDEDDEAVPPDGAHRGAPERAGDDLVAWVARNLSLGLAIVVGLLAGVALALYYGLR